MLSFFKSKKNSATGLVGVSVNSAGVAVSHIQANGSGRPNLVACNFFPSQDADSQRTALSNAVESMGLEGTGATYLLSPSQYSLLLVEPPQVSEEELKQAVRWRVKDLVDYDIDDAVVDVIPLPDDAFRGRTHMIYVVVAPKSAIETAEQLVNGSGLKLKYVDIAETALNNLLHYFDLGAQGTALMCLQPGQGVMNLTRNNQLYLSRGIKTDVNQLRGGGFEQSDTFSHLLLETQRSLDYYESQLGQAPVTQLMLTPLADGAIRIGDAMNTNLGVRAQIMDLSEHIDGASEMPLLLQQQCVLAIAGALRQEQP